MNIIEQLARSLSKRDRLAGSEYYPITLTEREIIIAALREASRPEEPTPLPLEVEAAHALKDFLLSRESDIAWSIEDFGGLLPVFKAVTRRDPSPTMNVSRSSEG